MVWSDLFASLVRMIVPLGPVLFAIALAIFFVVITRKSGNSKSLIFGIAVSFGITGIVFGMTFGMIDGSGLAQAMPALLAAALAYLGSTLQVPGKTEVVERETEEAPIQTEGGPPRPATMSRVQTRVEYGSTSLMSAVFATEDSLTARASPTIMTATATGDDNGDGKEERSAPAKPVTYDKTRVFVAVVALATSLLVGLNWGHTIARDNAQRDRIATAEIERLAAEATAMHATAAAAQAADIATAQAAQNAILAEEKAAADAQRAAAQWRLENAAAN
ncbi:hypothetical protein [Yoonia sp. 208BN28-4]|uniref:hypothetical protein n=1 Tax=Yoonia sp. 208BN28-4 TaxID=3126505 RepID=UPI0030AF793B